VDWDSGTYKMAIGVASRVKGWGIVVSKQPSLRAEGRFSVYFALGSENANPKNIREYWLIAGTMPPAIILADKTRDDERMAVKRFGKMYAETGECLLRGEGMPKGSTVYLLDDHKADPGMHKTILGIGRYLSSMAETFPWDKYGISGKVFVQ
jgi:hypothetical protein